MFMHDDNAHGTAVWTHRVLATIARNMGGGCSADVAELADRLRPVPWWDGCPIAADALPQDGAHRYRRLSLRTPSAADDDSVLLIAWPPGHVTAIHDHDGLWGIELVLDGVLQVESFGMTVTPRLLLAPRDVMPLGIGDHATFTEGDYAHRCRNLSARRAALSLHVYGGSLQRYRAYQHDAEGCWDSVPKRAELELAHR